MPQQTEAEREYQRRYYERHGDRVRAKTRAWRTAHPDGRREGDLKRRYRLTLTQFKEMLAAQGGGCAICGTDEPGGRWGAFFVDHDHSCCPGRNSCGACVRGLLCWKCNLRLEVVEDTTFMERAIAYLDGGYQEALREGIERVKEAEE